MDPQADLQSLPWGSGWRSASPPRRSTAAAELWEPSDRSCPATWGCKTECWGCRTARAGWPGWCSRCIEGSTIEWRWAEWIFQWYSDGNNTKNELLASDLSATYAEQLQQKKHSPFSQKVIFCSEAADNAGPAESKETLQEICWDVLLRLHLTSTGKNSMGMGICWG